MKNLTEYINTKHGNFEYCKFDKFIGFSLKEYGEYSDIELTIILHFIKEGDTVFDIGANIGAFSIPISKKIGHKGNLYCFEPQGLIFKILNNNLRKNKIKNTKTFQNSIGKNNKKILLRNIDYSKYGNFGGVSLVTSNHNEISTKEDSIEFKSLKLDNFLKIGKCDFIKVDVESMELDVLKGGKLFLAKYRPILWMENHPEKPNKLNKYLMNHNYNVYWVKSRLFNPNNYFKNQINHFKQICTENIIAVPKEKDQKLDTHLLEKVVDEFSSPNLVYWQI